MQSVEPSTCLVNTLSNEICRIYSTVVKYLLILERIVNLGIRHGTRVEPYVNEVKFTCHNLTCRRYKFDIIHVWTVKINPVIVLLAVVTRNKAFILVRIVCHDTGRNSLLNLVIEFLYRTDTDSLAILTCPDRKRSTPIAATAKVPVVKVLEPLAETACTSRLRFPCNGLVEFTHAFLHLRSTHEPAVKRIIEHRLVCTPAVRIIVDMLLNLEGDTTLLHYHAECNIKSLGLRCSLLIILAINSILRIVSVLHIGTGKL